MLRRLLGLAGGLPCVQSGPVDAYLGSADFKIESFGDFDLGQDTSGNVAGQIWVVVTFTTGGPHHICLIDLESDTAVVDVDCVADFTGSDASSAAAALINGVDSNGNCYVWVSNAVHDKRYWRITPTGVLSVSGNLDGLFTAAGGNLVEDATTQGKLWNLVKGVPLAGNSGYLQWGAGGANLVGSEGFSYIFQNGQTYVADRIYGTVSNTGLGTNTIGYVDIPGNTTVDLGGDVISDQFTGCVGPDGSLYVVTLADNVVKKKDSAGNDIANYTIGPVGANTGRYTKLFFDSQGYLWVTIVGEANCLKINASDMSLNATVSMNGYNATGYNTIIACEPYPSRVGVWGIYDAANKDWGRIGLIRSCP